MRTTVIVVLAMSLLGGVLWTSLVPGKAPMDNPQNHDAAPASQATPGDAKDLRTATLGSGCFWCSEGIFQRLNGVHSVVSGYSGGHVDNPTYRQICSGDTGHAEVVQLTYDPSIVTYPELLEVFWKTHDPTTLNRQGADVGTQYRSVIFYHDDEQRQLAEQLKKELDASGAFEDPIVTEIAPFEKFYEAEEYHQNYYNLNPQQQYCHFVVGPKIEKFKKVFADKLKPEAAADQ